MTFVISQRRKGLKKGPAPQQTTRLRAGINKGAKGMKSKFIKWLIVAAAVVTILSLSTTAISNVKGLIGNNGGADNGASETACVQVID